MLEIAICEDEQADRERLQGMLYAILDKYNMECQITCYSSYISAGIDKRTLYEYNIKNIDDMCFARELNKLKKVKT